MGQLRPCKWCGGRHRTRKAARKCALKHTKAKSWTLEEVGLVKK